MNFTEIIEADPALKAEIEKRAEALQAQRERNFIRVLQEEARHAAEFEPAVRDMLRGFDGTPAELDVLIDALAARGGVWKSADGRVREVQPSVDELLARTRGSGPFRSGEELKAQVAEATRVLAQHPDLGARIRQAELEGDWATALKLKNSVSNAQGHGTLPVGDYAQTATPAELQQQIRAAESVGDWALAFRLKDRLLYGAPKAAPTPAPPPGRSELQEQIAAAEAKGDWATSLRLKNTLADVNLTAAVQVFQHEPS